MSQELPARICLEDDADDETSVNETVVLRSQEGILKNEKENIIREIKKMLVESISGRKIAATMHIAHGSVSKYATGNPEYLAEKSNLAFIGLIPFQDERSSSQDICEKMFAGKFLLLLITAN